MELTCPCNCTFSVSKKQEICFCPSCGTELTPSSAVTVALNNDGVTPVRDAGPQLERLGEFRVLRKIGHGGMGDVYEAIQDNLNRRVAVKVLPAGDTSPEQVLRFQHEAEAIAKLKHENIVEIYTYGEEGGFYYFAMALIQGNNLETLLQSEVLNLDRVLDIALQICSALAKAHEVGVIHRDIKPGNILVEPGGKVWVTDFGLAKWARQKGLTNHGEVLGTPEYMSPEQCEGRALGPGTDIYSFGVLLYRMLGGQVPFDADEPLAILLKHLREEPTDLRELNADVPLELGGIVMRCLAKAEFDRYQSMAALSLALEQFRKDLNDLRTFLSRDGVDTEKLVVDAMDGASRGLHYVQVTVLVADMENFLRLVVGQLPEVVTHTLELFFAEVRKTIEGRKGTVVELFGDTILASFGDPIPLEDHGAVALETALELQAVLARLSQNLETKVSVRIGVETGVVLGGFLSDGKQRIYNVFGEAAASAYALEMNAGRSQILVGDTLVRLMGERFEFAPTGPFSAGTHERPVELRAHRLLARAQTSATGGRPQEAR